MSIPATQLRPGMIIKHNNELHSVFSVEHRTPGNLRAFIQAKLRNLRTGAMFEHRFRSPDPIEKVNVDEVNMEFLYADGDSYYFMDTESYEQTAPESRDPRRCGGLPDLESADQGGVFRWQGGGHRVAADGGADRDWKSSRA
jgi:translation elongation factor P/translation initiation factor 5A